MLLTHLISAPFLLPGASLRNGVGVKLLLANCQAIRQFYTVETSVVVLKLLLT